jgi:hypothetical protein
MTGTAVTRDGLHRLVFAVGLAASAIVGVLSNFHGQASEYGTGVTGAEMIAPAMLGYRPNLAAQTLPR